MEENPPEYIKFVFPLRWKEEGNLNYKVFFFAEVNIMYSLIILFLVIHHILWQQTIFMMFYFLWISNITIFCDI